MRWPALFVTLSFGCATSSPAPVVAATPVTPPDPEVASAFEPEPTAPAPTVTARPPPPLPDVRAAFRAAFESAQRALQTKSTEGAKAEARRAAEEAATLGFVEQMKAAELAFRAAAMAGPAGEARAAAKQWLETCAGDAVESCRAQALSALLSTARLDAASAREVRDEVSALQKTEACLKTAERTRKPERCLPDAEKVVRASRDDFLTARLSLVRALMAPEPKQAALLEGVDGRCEAKACVSVQRRALAELVARARAEKRVDEVARLLLRDGQRLASTLPASERPWARPVALDPACAAVDGASGPGACRKLERQLTGGWTFRDFSKELSRDGLSADQVRAVNEHYAPLLQDCLGAQARRLKPPDAVRYDVRWMVFNDGRVGEVHLRDSRLDDSELGRCLKAQFVSWRYPRYEGEWQHVEQSFTVTAVERRSER